MRAIVVLLLVSAICLLALVRPKVGLWGYIWFALMRPDYLAYIPDRFPLSICMAVATLIGGVPLISRNFSRIFRNPFTVMLLLLQIPFVASVLGAPYVSLALPQYLMVIRALSVILLAPMILKTEDDLRITLLVMGTSVALVGGKFGLGGILHGGAVYTLGYTGFMSDNNTLALALAMGIPFCWYGRRMLTKPWMKLSLLFLVFTNIATVIMTMSRGSALALGTAMLKITMQSKQKVLVFIGLALLVLPSFLLMQAQFSKRMETLQSLERDSSAMSRIAVAKIAISIWEQHPLLGVGFGGQNFLMVTRDATGNSHVVHNSYLQMLADCGIFAFLMFTGLIVWAFLWLGKSARKVKRTHPGMEIYPYAIQMSLLIYAIASMFYPRAYFDFFYMLIVVAGLWNMLSKELPPSVAVQQPPGQILLPPPRTPAINNGVPGFARR